MDITPLTPKGRQIITRYGNGGFVVNETHYTGNILILPDQVLAWPVADMRAAMPESFAPLFAHVPPPEILLIGAGAKFVLLAEVLRSAFKAQAIAADIMDTGAACRTYNVLLAEDRRVAAALIAV